MWFWYMVAILFLSFVKTPLYVQVLSRETLYSDQAEQNLWLGSGTVLWLLFCFCHLLKLLSMCRYYHGKPCILIKLNRIYGWVFIISWKNRVKVPDLYEGSHVVYVQLLKTPLLYSGITTGNPILIQLNRIYGWVPDPCCGSNFVYPVVETPSIMFRKPCILIKWKESTARCQIQNCGSHIVFLLIVKNLVAMCSDQTEQNPWRGPELAAICFLSSAKKLRKPRCLRYPVVENPSVVCSIATTGNTIFWSSWTKSTVGCQI